VSFRKPLGDVLAIHPCIRRSLLALQDTIATRLGNERRTSHPRVEVVVEEMVEARVHDCSTSTVALKRNRDIEMLSRRQTRSGRDDPRMLFFGRRDGDCSREVTMAPPRSRNRPIAAQSRAPRPPPTSTPKSQS